MIPTLLGPISPTEADTVGILSSIVTLLCVGPLVWLTWRRRAEPRPGTWAVWFFVGLVGTIGMATGGAPFSSWILKLGLSLGPAVVAAVALYRGVPWRATLVDRWSMATAAGGLLVYAAVYFGSGGPDAGLVAGTIAVAVAMFVDFVGAIPTWYQAWREPSEPIITYAVAWCAVVAVLLTLPLPWTFLSAGYLVFLALQMASIIFALVWGRRRARQLVPA